MSKAAVLKTLVSIGSQVEVGDDAAFAAQVKDLEHAVDRLSEDELKQLVGSEVNFTDVVNFGLLVWKSAKAAREFWDKVRPYVNR